jgi:hypothetical protein
MKILSHRGYWKTASEKNTPTAFRRSFDLGFGTETDVRDLAGELVISHDAPTGSPISLLDFLMLAGEASLPLAINIKSDGLAKLLAQHFSSISRDWFAFDMSIPDMRSHLDTGNPVFVRMSEVERSPPWLGEAHGVWLDAFGDEWYDIAFIKSLLDTGKRVCVVSSELHNRDPASLWETLSAVSQREGLMLCTDRPEEAQCKFFGAKVYD